MREPKKLAAGAIVARHAGGDWLLLVLRAYRNWDFPKGVVEAGEEPFAAALREVGEETGLTDLEFPLGEEHCDTLPYAGGKIARYYLAETTEENVRLPISAELGRPEHHEWRWVSFEEAEDLLPPRLAIVLDWVRRILPSGES
ncbi:MAG: NUDIX domain-containing protein [Betaproteobacteria bacterium]|nr:NUDIX domain-containing protein [Betaproteobacteria bacterium]